MSQRGHVLLLTLLVLIAAGISAVLFAGQVAVRIEDRQPDAIRNQALWLARSALDAGVTGTRTVSTDAGTATVRASATKVTVELEGGVAVVTTDPWTERYITR